MNNQIKTKGVSKPHRQPHLLLVDDDPTTLQLLVDSLNPMGVRIFTAINASQAMKINRDQPLDLALVDLRLPDLSGIEVLDAVRRLHPDSLRMLMTAYCDFEAATSAVNRVGIYHILIKPIEIEYLTSVVNTAIKHIEAEWERSSLEARLLLLNRRLEDELIKRTRDAKRFKRDLLHTKNELERIFWELVSSNRLSTLGLTMGVLAHDVRNPLTVLSGQLQILNFKPPADPALANRYNVMLRQVERIQSLMESVSLIAQTDVQMVALFPLRQAIQEASNLTRKLFSTKELVVVRGGSAEEVKIRGNFGHWVHVLFKLLMFIGRRTSGGQVNIVSKMCGALVQLRISYPETHFPKILKRVVTARSLGRQTRENQEATAFYLCARILEQYGGVFRIIERSQRTTFILTAPLSSDQPEFPPALENLDACVEMANP